MDLAADAAEVLDHRLLIVGRNRIEGEIAGLLYRVTCGACNRVIPIVVPDCFIDLGEPGDLERGLWSAYHDAEWPESNGDPA